MRLMNHDRLIFSNGELELAVTVGEDKENVWLSADQMAELFNSDRKTIRRHIDDVFNENEVNQKNNIKTKLMEDVNQTESFYSLEVILSVGYRIGSQRGIAFRQWAIAILKDYMFQGYAVNQKRLEVLHRAIEIQSEIQTSALDSCEQEVLNVIDTYTDALSLLDDYDHQCIVKPEGSETLHRLSYDECCSLIEKMRFESDVFGVEKEKGKLEGILAAVYQNVFGKELYPSIEEKAAHLLYFLIKDHPFADGCKRIAATVFLEFLNKNDCLVTGGRQIISNSALVAMTLMIAESRPEEKELMINLIMNFLE